MDLACYLIHHYYGPVEYQRKSLEVQVQLECNLKDFGAHQGKPGVRVQTLESKHLALDLVYSVNFTPNVKIWIIN